MASQHDPNALIQKFLAEIGYSFVDDIISEIKEALVVHYLILEAFKIFNMETQSEQYRREQMNVLCNHYGHQINNITRVIHLQQRRSYQRFNKKLDFKISVVFLMKSSKLNYQAKKQAQQKVLKIEIKQKDIHMYLNTINTK